MLLGPLAAEAVAYGLEARSGPTLRIRLFATDGFTTELPIQVAADIPIGGFAEVEEAGILQPVLLLREFGFVWEEISHSATIGVTQIPITMRFDSVLVRFMNSTGQLNASALLMGARVDITADEIAGVILGSLVISGEEIPISLDPSQYVLPWATAKLQGESPSNFSVVTVFDDNNNTQIVPFTTPLGQVGGIDFSLAVGVDLDRTSSFSASATPIPEPATLLLVLVGLVGLGAFPRRQRACASGPGGRGDVRGRWDLVQHPLAHPMGDDFPSPAPDPWKTSPTSPADW